VFDIGYTYMYKEYETSPGVLDILFTQFNWSMSLCISFKNGKLSLLLLGKRFINSQCNIHCPSFVTDYDTGKKPL